MMKIALAVLLLCASGARAAAGTTSAISFSSPLKSSTNAKVASYSNGKVISFSDAGFVVSEEIAVTDMGTTNGPTIYWKVLSDATATTATSVGAGFVQTKTSDGTTCTNTLLKAETVIVNTGASATCKGDFSTYYTTTVPGTTTSLITSTGTKGTTYAMTLLQGTSGTYDCYVPMFGTAGAALAVATGTVADGVCSGFTAPAKTALVKTATFAFYIEQTDSSKISQVCVQTPAQYSKNAGDCGTASSSSASLVSVLLAPFALIALMIFA